MKLTGSIGSIDLKMIYLEPFHPLSFKSKSIKMESTLDNFQNKVKSMEKESSSTSQVKSIKDNLKMTSNTDKATNTSQITPTTKDSSRRESNTDEESSNGATAKSTMGSGNKVIKLEVACGRVPQDRVI